MSEIPSAKNPESLIDTHKAAVEQIIRTVYLDYAGPNRTKPELAEYNGEIGGVRYSSRHPFKGGKQQAVIVLTLTFPEGESFDMVLKKDTDGVFEQQKKSPVLQEIFPKIFMEVDQVAAIEFIDGIELEPFQELIKDPRTFEQFLTDAFEAFDKVSSSEFEFTDIRFTTGHNFIYDKLTKKFRAFDIHSLHPSEKTYEEKFITHLEDSMKHWQVTPEDVKLFMHFIRSFLVKYPGKKLEYTGKGTVTLKPGDPGYEEAWQKILKNLEGLGWLIANQIPTSEEKEGVFTLNQALMDAAIKDDEAAFLEAYHSNAEHVYNLAV